MYLIMIKIIEQLGIGIYYLTFDILLSEVNELEHKNMLGQNLPT